MVLLLTYPRKIYFSSRLQGAATTSFRKPYRSPFTQKFRTFWSDPNFFKRSRHFPNGFSERKLRKPFTSFFQFKPFINFDMFCLVAFRKNSSIWKTKYQQQNSQLEFLRPIYTNSGPTSFLANGNLNKIRTISDSQEVTFQCRICMLVSSIKISFIIKRKP